MAGRGFAEQLEDGSVGRHVLGPADGAQSVARICIYVGSNGPGSEKPSIDSAFA